MTQPFQSLLNIKNFFFQGGITYWGFGYGLSYGPGPGTNPVFGFGSWFVSAEGLEMGPVYTTFLFQVTILC